jgi:hypothetical protein
MALLLSHDPRRMPSGCQLHARLLPFHPLMIAYSMRDMRQGLAGASRGVQPSHRGEPVAWQRHAAGGHVLAAAKR